VPDLKFMDTKQPLLFFEVDLSTARPHPDFPALSAKLLARSGPLQRWGPPS